MRRTPDTSRAGFPLSLLAPVLLALPASLQACGGAQSPAGPPPAGSTELHNNYQDSGQTWLNAWPESSGPFLWRVERGDAVSHIFGTVHVGITLDELPAVVRERLDASHSLIVEADTEELSDPLVLMRLMLPPGESLHRMLGKEYWHVLVKHLGQFFPTPILDRLPPWMVQIMLSVDNPTAGGDSLDTQIVNRARAQKKRLLYLESAALQMDLLDRLIGVKELRETLDDVPGARKSLRVLLRAYRRGNLPALAGLTLDPQEMAKDPERFELMLFGRNRAWMDMLTRELQGGGVFVAVGAAHYVGEDGLLELLRRAGFRITRVSAESAVPGRPGAVPSE